MAETLGADEMDRWGTRFADRATEERYIVWERERANAFNRAGLYASLASWIGGAPIVAWAAPDGIVPWLVAVGAVCAVIALALAATYVDALSPWAYAFSALANALAGATIIGLLAVHFGDVTLACGGTVIVFFYAGGILRMRPFQALCAVSKQDRVERDPSVLT